MKTIYILAVYLSLSATPQLWLTEKYEDVSECIRWANFYNEYPFMALCVKKEVTENE